MSQKTLGAVSHKAPAQKRQPLNNSSQLSAGTASQGQEQLVQLQRRDSQGTQASVQRQDIPEEQPQQRAGAGAWLC